ncbi:MAG: hypothetical protein PUG67_05760 [Peptoniphilaceae bacterium]|nr:hypothetical protein [Peptoniphilaceae bacterium]MDY6018987.1 hypothetical protein [Anaerococcus sp.]
MALAKYVKWVDGDIEEYNENSEVIYKSVDKTLLEKLHTKND